MKPNQIVIASVLSIVAGTQSAKADWFSIPSSEWPVQVVGVDKDQDGLMRAVTFRCGPEKGELLVSSEWTFSPEDDEQIVLEVAFPTKQQKYTIEMKAADDGAGLSLYRTALSSKIIKSFQENLLVSNAGIFTVLKSPSEDFRPTFKISGSGGMFPGMSASQKCLTN